MSDAVQSLSTATTPLRPCPFCAGETGFYDNYIDHELKWSVSCGDCNANLDVCEDTKTEAAAKWNARPGDVAQRPADSGVLVGYVAAYCGQKLFIDTEDTAEFYRKLCDVTPVYSAPQPASNAGGGDVAYDAGNCGITVQREDLADMLDSWADAANYKGDYLREKHGDVEEIAKYRAKYLAVSSTEGK